MYNNIELSGQIIKLYPIRYTLQKIPIVSFVLKHESVQIERKKNKAVICRIYCIYIEDNSLLNIDLVNRHVKINGFLSLNAKSQLIVHAKKVDFLEP